MSGLKSWVLAGTVVLVGCGEPGGLGLELRFATLQQAQSSGLPDGIAGLEVELLRWEDGDQLDQLGCIDLDSEPDQRQGLSLDVVPGALRVVVRGYEDSACSGEASWAGSSKRADVIEGEELVVPVYVTLRGLALNPIRGSLPAGRAFATATPLPDGTVLVAGGFESLIQSQAGSAAQMAASCEALIYDPGQGRFLSTVVPMLACRGLHQAVALADGSVLLVGGSQSAKLDPFGQTRPALLPDVGGLVGVVERYDPALGRFVQVASSDALARASAAVALIDGADERLLVAGGRTTQSWRSDDIMLGAASTASQWSFESASLLAPRIGAQAVSCGGGVLVYGGNEYEAALLERVDPDSLLSTDLEIEGQAVAGHSFQGAEQTDGSYLAWVAGGLPDQSGSSPRSEMLRIGWIAGSGFDFQPQARTLLRARAYHLALQIQGADPGWVFAGGLGASMWGRDDLELHRTGDEASMLEGTLSTGSLGSAGALLPDGSWLLAGGVHVDADYRIELSAEAELLSP
ncbi:MAG: hypothetical protein JXR96_29475 [Deltaproteobacteria bacterium]|nr:hypothetical protein [Deltaproteobacteria bacterium]